MWVSTINPRDYHHAIVQWDGDTAAQKTSWMVGNDGNRRWIPDLATFQCLHDTGSGNAISASSDVLDTLPNLNNVWATCGADRIGVNGALEENSYLQAGGYRLTITSTEVDLTNNGHLVWANTIRAGAQLKLQTDGNLVSYNADGTAHWATNTVGSGAAWLVLGTDGSLRLYNAGGRQIWSG
ncbi:hypothetical protein F0L68_04750 [Solihabitans fulvus]|uniref:Bulb-type lectin domain-containing protein n=1 Tax=Solihabitans fulvus TaxID=1892852 RepID=A0A5B2XRB4_9PSEU|nr:hypothetical protein [Solihabitans fulvus]KAA2265379.1 hypothetical protein F0L68_04750 [Solihabitans fulvus]